MSIFLTKCSQHIIRANIPIIAALPIKYSKSSHFISLLTRNGNHTFTTATNRRLDDESFNFTTVSAATATANQDSSSDDEWDFEPSDDEKNDDDTDNPDAVASDWDDTTSSSSDDASDDDTTNDDTQQPSTDSDSVTSSSSDDDDDNNGNSDGGNSDSDDTTIYTQKPSSSVSQNESTFVSNKDSQKQSKKGGFAWEEAMELGDFTTLASTLSSDEQKNSDMTTPSLTGDSPLSFGRNESRRAPMIEAPPSAQIKFGNLNFYANKNDIRDYCTEILGADIDDRILDISMPPNRRYPGQNKGFAFLTMDDVATATLVKEKLHNTDFQSRAIRVDFALPRSDRPPNTDRNNPAPYQRNAPNPPPLDTDATMDFFKSLLEDTDSKPTQKIPEKSNTITDLSTNEKSPSLSPSLSESLSAGVAPMVANITVSNLSQSTTTEILQKMFGILGNVSNIRLTPNAALAHIEIDLKIDNLAQPTSSMTDTSQFGNDTPDLDSLLRATDASMDNSNTDIDDTERIFKPSLQKSELSAMDTSKVGKKSRKDKNLGFPTEVADLAKTMAMSEGISAEEWDSILTTPTKKEHAQSNDDLFEEILEDLESD